MTYLEKLKDPRWQKKRLTILERDEWQCQHCGEKSNTLHVHHTYYKPGANPWDANDKTLITLCADCHKEEPDSFDFQCKILINILKRAGVTSYGMDPVQSHIAEIYNLKVLPNE
jgi:NAD-dependent SIR2 family protein deacetylase